MSQGRDSFRYLLQMNSITHCYNKLPIYICILICCLLKIFFQTKGLLTYQFIVCLLMAIEHFWVYWQILKTSSTSCNIVYKQKKLCNLCPNRNIQTLYTTKPLYVTFISSNSNFPWLHPNLVADYFSNTKLTVDCSSRIPHIFMHASPRRFPELDLNKNDLKTTFEIPRTCWNRLFILFFSCWNKDWQHHNLSAAGQQDQYFPIREDWDWKSLRFCFSLFKIT